MPTLQSILKSPTIEANTNIINSPNKTAIVPVKQDDHTANVTNVSSVQSQTTPTSSKKPSKQIVQSASKLTNVVCQQPIEDSAQNTFLNISNSPQKSPNKTHFKKESTNATAVSFKTLNNNKENQSIRKVRSKSLCNEFENANVEKNLKNSIFLNKSNSNLKAASSLNEDFANFDSNVKSKILTLANNQHQNTNLKRKLSKQGQQQQQQSPDRKRKRLNHE